MVRKQQHFKAKLTETRRVLFLLAGVAMATYGLKGFLLNRGLVDGGVTGISLLASQLSGAPLSWLIILINLPFALLGVKMVNRAFAVRSVFAVCLLAVGIALFDFPLITKDVWLISVFGGFFVGGGLGLVIRGGGILDGTELLAIYLSRYRTLSASDISLIFNIVLFSLVAWLLNVEIAMYSVLTYFSSAKTTEYIVEGVEEYIGVTIVSEKHPLIRQAIIDKLGRGVTLYHGVMGHGKRGQLINETEIIYTVITRLELAKLQHEIDLIDRNAFIAMGSVLDTRGGIIKKRPLVN